MSEAPAILLLHDPAAPAALVSALQRGCEEESVPVVARAAAGEAESLARRAAAGSALFLGIGVDGHGTVTLHEHRLGGRPPLARLETASLAQARRIGTAAGRIARGRPLPPEPG